ncbi:hypothetical protein BG011_005234 [Mortierella polycephala]|uniref:FAD-binding domain-containing protein n=1 Tax=Mortierella polycephala TaxID=41804 RepID=A0A9P6U172_9FUNG|nr:hypothetical protein BG011_005234 [Mortierella polycephala]
MSHYPFPLSPTTGISNKENAPPHVMIVGAGIAGLLLGILLDRAGIPFRIYESGIKLQPEEGVVSLHAGIFPVFEQLGLYENVERLSLRIAGFHIHQDDMTKIGTLVMKDGKTVLGYDHMMFCSISFHEFLASLIPPGRIHFNKKVSSIEENRDGVMIRCSDGTPYHGDILVGADGGNSGVRQGLYKLLQNRESLPVVDGLPMRRGYMCMMGVTDPLDPGRFPVLDQHVSKAYQVLGRSPSPFSWCIVSVSGYRINWKVIVQLEAMSPEVEERLMGDSRDDSVDETEYWSDRQQQQYSYPHYQQQPKRSSPGLDGNAFRIDALMKEVNGFMTPFGGTLGDLFDSTQRHEIMLTYLENKVFETWHHGRTVLIGDACHKLLPTAGQETVASMQDAVVLANCLYDLKSPSLNDIGDAFKDFKAERYAHVKEIDDISKVNAKLIYGQTFMDRFTRYMFLTCMPRSLQVKNIAKGMVYRPQAVFLPRVPHRGTGAAYVQRPSRKYQDKQRQQQHE